MKEKFIKYIRNLSDDELSLVVASFFCGQVESKDNKFKNFMLDIWCQIYDEAEIYGMIDPEKGSWFDRVDGVDQNGFKHFSRRTLSVLENQNIFYFYELRNCTPLQIRRWRNSGMKVLLEIQYQCSERGIKLKEDMVNENER
tara:strand:+ start:3683 stop:4108 length:426 start_codon:yes stop_codon:yes gene_type:complete